MIIFLIALLILSVLFEGIVTTLPLTLTCLICFAVMKRDTSVFLPAFLSGLFLDVFRVHAVGSTSLFFVGFLFLILLYKKKYEIYSMPFVLLATFFGTFFFLFVFRFNDAVLQSGLCAFFGVLLFAVLRFFGDSRARKEQTRFLSV